MSRKLKIFVSLFTVTALCAVAAVLLVTTADTVIKNAVEAHGARITGVPVSLARVDLLDRPGHATLNGLVVANPKGFRADDAFRLGRIRVEYDIASLTQPILVINRIVIDSPEITLEAGRDGSNFDVLRRATARRRESPTRNAAFVPHRFIVGELVIRDARVNVTGGGADMRRIGARIPELRIAGIGLEEGGVGPGAIVRRVLDSVGEAVGEPALPSLSASSPAADASSGAIDVRPVPLP